MYVGWKALTLNPNVCIKAHWILCFREVILIIQSHITYICPWYKHKAPKIGPQILTISQNLRSNLWLNRHAFHAVSVNMTPLYETIWGNMTDICIGAAMLVMFNFCLFMTHVTDVNIFLIFEWVWGSTLRKITIQAIASCSFDHPPLFPAT